MDFLRAFLRAKLLIKSLKVSDQWPAEVWWCRGDCLIVCPLPMSSSVWWSLLLDMRCFQSHNMTSYLHLQTNVLAKFVDAICLLFCTHFPYSLLYSV